MGLLPYGAIIKDESAQYSQALFTIALENRVAELKNKIKNVETDIKLVEYLSRTGI